MTRGTTLIEAMVAIAILGIVIAMSGQTATALRSESVEAVLWERAQQVLEHEASALIEGRQPDAKTREALMEALPGGKLEKKPNYDGVVLVVSWKAPRGVNWSHRELYLVGKVR